MKPIILPCIITLFLSSVFSIQRSFSQSASEVLSFTSKIPIPQKRNYQAAHQNKNEVELIFSGLFLFYKSFVSSQDANSCVFTPSCSEYALVTIKKKGLLIGTADTFDRLTRCNGFSAENYKRTAGSDLLVDSLKISYLK